MRAVIVASGPSARGFKPPAGVTVISVNGSIDWLSRADIWFTLDPSTVNMTRMKKRRPGVEYYAAMAHPPEGVKRLQRVSSRGTEPQPRHTPEWWLWRWSATLGFSQYPEEINTGNSAWGALQLACQLGAKKVALIGVDATNAVRVEGGRPNNLSHLPLLFNSAIGKIDFVNCGHMKSKVPKMTIEEGMEWLIK